MTVSSVLVQGLTTGIPLATYRTLVGKDQFRPGSVFPPGLSSSWPSQYVSSADSWPSAVGE